MHIGRISSIYSIQILIITVKKHYKPSYCICTGINKWASQFTHIASELFNFI